jgi:hypothetical protein
MSFVQAKPRATHDLYAVIHKALRLAETQMLTRLGACDAADAQMLAATLADLRGVLHISEHHLANEDIFVHTALDERAPGAVMGLDRDHAHHRHAFEELEALTVETERADPVERPGALRALYLRYSLFIAEDFAHMAEEEQLIMPVLQSLFTDAELIDIEVRIKASLKPEELIAMGRFMLPASNRHERLALMSGVKAAAPPEAFQAVLNLAARPTLPEADFAELCERLGLAA